VPSPLHSRLQSGLRELLGGAVELVPPGQFAAFVIDCQPGVDPGTAVDEGWSCTLLDPQGESPVATLTAREDSMAQEIARVIARTSVVGAMLALENPTSRIQLEMRVRGEAARTERPVGKRGVVITADLSPHRLHFYQPGTRRTPQNSLQLEIRSDRDCYLTLVDADSEGGVLQFFPNELSERAGYYPDGRISAGETVLIPDSLESGNRAGFHTDYGPPAGEDTIRAFCATHLCDAQTLRDRIARISSSKGARSPVAVRGVFSDLGRDLSAVATRGLVVSADQPAPAATVGSSSTPEADWTAATITLRIDER
jgi:hypothetical protein